jgi:hypothetical protein
MKTNRNLLKAVAAAALASIAGLAAASGTTDVQVTASVPTVCTFNSVASVPVIALGSMDPSLVPATGVSGSVDVTYNCTNGTAPAAISVSGGGARNLTAGANTIPYTFSLGTPGAGVGYVAAGSSKVVATATVTQAAVQAANAGSYSDTVTLSINN